ncbi:hypothetical protein [Mangrovibacterium marinum]|uniref:Uncharacterized protein n=1 Tax=Mangrovibacterium marinum TaxID=1639118 RepID=A0A2T5C180_9BACT|nr:hypothetical protein [Mangrovibacterium marinum]PTN08388.1 hypothetical protein C8N47_109124 [Mangrovibacterium marinum]
MIKTAIISADAFNPELSNRLGQLKELQVKDFLSGYNQLSEHMLHAQAESIIRASELTYFDQLSPSFDLIKLALRNRNNLYFSQLPKLNEQQFNELIRLSQEADTSIQLAVPLLFNKQILKAIPLVKAPFLANIRLSAADDQLTADAFFQLLLMLVWLDQGDCRKTDSMTFADAEGLSILEARLAFHSGSIARILLSKHFREKDTGIELFSPDMKPLRVKTDSNYFNACRETEYNAISNLINNIRKKPAVVLNLTQLQQAQQIFRSFQQKTNFAGKQFS